VPFGSLRKEFLIPGRKSVLGLNWEGKTMDEKVKDNIILFQHIKYYNEIGLDGNVYRYTRTSCLNCND